MRQAQVGSITWNHFFGQWVPLAGGGKRAKEPGVSKSAFEKIELRS